jgi:hypothetical protein
MGTGGSRAPALALALLLACAHVTLVAAQDTERIEGTRRGTAPFPLSNLYLFLPSGLLWKLWR